jgi:addiction module RelE/StbE family toxin
MNPVEIQFSRNFEKKLRKSPLSIKKAFRARLDLLIMDPYHPSLHLHSLTGKYRSYKSINVTGDWRAIFREFEEGEIIYFDYLGTHSQLYS